MKKKFVTQSNLFAIQTNPTKHLAITVPELEQFIGMLFYMSIVRMPLAEMYWSVEMRHGKVADVMPIVRFKTIKLMLHINDNTSRPVNCQDRLYKIRPFIDAVVEKDRGIVPAGKFSIDEQVVPFKGKSVLIAYNPKKPKTWGYKIDVLSGMDGLIHNLEVYTGKIEPCPGKPDIKASGNIVLRLLAVIPRGVWQKYIVTTGSQAWGSRRH